MLLHHPEIGSLKCSDCKRWIYDIKTGKKLERHGEPQRRKPGTTLPCATCPRESPEKEAETTLMPCNEKTLMLYLAVRGGAALTQEESEDPIIRRNFAMLQIIHDNWRQRNQANELTQGLMAAGMFGKQHG